jgi:hypothetical protein
MGNMLCNMEYWKIGMLGGNLCPLDSAQWT